MRREDSLRPARALLHPLFWVSLVTLVVNDHLLKGADVLDSWWTGKLSDVAGLLVAPMVLATIGRVTTRRGVLGCHLAVGLGFGALNLWPDAARAVEVATAVLGVPWRIWPDPSDLLALPALAASHHWLGRAAARPRLRASWARLAQACGLVAGLFACTATSIARAPQPAVSPSGVVAQGWYADPLLAIDPATGATTGRLEITASVDAPVVSDGVLFAADEGEVGAYELASGKQRWGLPRPEDGYRMSPLLVHGGRVFVHFLPGTTLGGLSWDERQLEALDEKTGKPLWRVPATGAEHPPVPLGDGLLVNLGSALQAVDATTGKVRWSFPGEGERTLSSPVVIGDRVWVGDDRGALHALDAATGRQLERRSTGDEDAFLERYFRTEPRLSTDGRHLFFVTHQTLHVVDGHTFAEAWKLEGVDGVVVGEELVVARMVTDEFVTFVAATGWKLWRAEIHDAVLTRPILVAGTVVIRPQAAVLYGFDARTGALKWTVDLETGATVGGGDSALLVRGRRR